MNATGVTEAQGVWGELVGQQAAVDVLRRAVASSRGGGQGHAMSHAWLFTGPPGSGRSNAARAFAAALQCARGGCGECSSCRTMLSGAHPDLTWVSVAGLSIGIELVRELVMSAATSPVTGRWKIIVIEDADRVTDYAYNGLLKAIEEPAARTLWMLCAPSPDDMLPTIRSRCRHVQLATPADEAVTELLMRRDGVDAPMAAYAARAAQGHIGRARALARDEESRLRRRRILDIPRQLTSIGSCLVAAENLVQQAADDAAQQTAALDEKERAALSQSLGVGTKGARPRSAAAALKDLEEEQKKRAKRIQRDSLDRVLTELTTWYRDVLGVQTGALSAEEQSTDGVHLINIELRHEVQTAARQSTPEETVRRIDAILLAREALETNVAPLLAIEALMVSLASPGTGRHRVG